MKKRKAFFSQRAILLLATMLAVQAMLHEEDYIVRNVPMCIFVGRTTPQPRSSLISARLLWLSGLVMVSGIFGAAWVLKEMRCFLDQKKLT